MGPILGIVAGYGFSDRYSFSSWSHSPLLCQPKDRLPPGNADLKEIRSVIDKITSTVQKCRDMQCPAMNCASANELAQSMITTEMALDDMLKWLLEAGSMQRQDFACRTGDRQLTDLQLSQGFRTLALQTYFHNLGDTILKIVSFRDYLKSVDKNFFAVDIRNFDRTSRHSCVTHGLRSLRQIR